MDTQFGKDLGMDSLDYNDALVALEEEFDVVFDDKVANEIKTVGEAVEYIQKNSMPEEDILDKEIRWEDCMYCFHGIYVLNCSELHWTVSSLPPSSHV